MGPQFFDVLKNVQSDFRKKLVFISPATLSMRSDYWFYHELSRFALP